MQSINHANVYLRNIHVSPYNTPCALNRMTESSYRQQAGEMRMKGGSLQKKKRHTTCMSKLIAQKIE